MWREKDSIIFVGGGVHTVNIGFKCQIIGCSNCAGNHPLDEYRQPDKVISMPNHVVNPQQQARDNMRDVRL